MADSSLAKKLLIKPGHRIVVINPPAGYWDELGQLPEGVEVAEKPEGPFDFVHLFVKNVDELERFGPSALDAVKRDCLLWISYPKGSSKVKTDISRDVGWDSIKKAGFVGVAMVSINDTWSALRFRPVDLVGTKKS